MSLFPDNWNLNIPFNKQVINIIQLYAYPIYIRNRIEKGGAAIKNVKEDITKYYQDIQYTKRYGRTCSEINGMLYIY